MTNPYLDNFLINFKQFIDNSTFVKLSLGNYKGTELDLKNVYIKPVIIKREAKLSFTYRYKTRDIVKNFSLEEGQVLVQSLLDSGFKIATLLGLEDEFQFELLPSGKSVLRTKILENKNNVSTVHDKKKRKLVAANSNYLHALKITDAYGTVYNNTQDKFKQINKYVEILAPLIKEVGVNNSFNVVDMGAGKGYLTFALYDYLVNSLNKKAHVKGIEFRQDLVDICNLIAQQSGFENLSFEQGTIQDYKEQADLLIALHACDTATDDAIFKGIKANAKLIVVAPCCHKQIRKEIEKAKVKNDVSFLTKHGIFLERQAEMTTDGLRAMYLEYAGYKTKVFEFISDAHTPKNVMIVGIKKKEKSDQSTLVRQAKILADIEAVKSYFGIKYHHLGRLLKL